MKTIVFTAGCYDALHEGHLKFLERAQALGDYFVVGINDDAYFKKKGPNRPLDTAELRKQKIYQTDLVDEVVVFSGSPLELIKSVQPQIIAVCDEYTNETTVGWPECEAWGGRVHIMPRTPNISTTQILTHK